MTPGIGSSCMLRAAAAAAVALAVLGTGGCYGRAWIAADSWTEAPGRFRRDQPQWVHVGETVRFDFRVKPVIEDYVVFDFPDGQTLVPAGPTVEYRVSRAFNQVSDPHEVRVTGTAYRTAGMQDVELVGGRLMGLQTPDDPPDQRVARAAIRLVVYQSRAEFRVSGPDADRTDWPRSFVQIETADGRLSEPVGPLAVPGGIGFRVAAPQEDGSYILTILPTADQVNRGGTTLAHLHLAGKDGGGKLLTVRFDTP